MKRKVNILVHDSYHTKFIVEKIQALFGDRVNCYGLDESGTVKADVIVLSGRDIIDGGQEVIQDWKQQGGRDSSKVVAVSVLADYLNKIKSHAELSVDALIPKKKLVDGLGGDDWGNESVEITFERLFETIEY